MACLYSPGIVDLIDERWATYPFTRDDVVDMIARICRPSTQSSDNEVAASERAHAEFLLANCD